MMPLFNITVVVMRGSVDTSMACSPPQEWPITATFEVSTFP